MCLCYWSMFLENMGRKKNNIDVGVWVCLCVFLALVSSEREKKTNLLERENNNKGI